MSRLGKYAWRGLLAGGLMTVGLTPSVAGAAASSATTVTVAAITAALTAGGTYLVKEYFDGRRETRELERQTDDILEEVKRLETRCAALDAENAAWREKIVRANEAAAFWIGLIREDEEFLKPRARPERADLFEGALEKLYIRQPELVEKMNAATASPASDAEREIILKAYGAGAPGADFWELKSRLDAGLRGGVAKVTGESGRRYVSGAENLMAIVDYVRAVGGEEYATATFARLWGLSPEETAALMEALPAP